MARTIFQYENHGREFSYEKVLETHNISVTRNV